MRSACEMMMCGCGPQARAEVVAARTAVAVMAGQAYCRGMHARLHSSRDKRVFLLRRAASHSFASPATPVHHEPSHPQFTLLPSRCCCPKAAARDRSHRGHHQRERLQPRFLKEVRSLPPTYRSLFSSPHPTPPNPSVLGRIDWPALLQAAASLSQAGMLSSLD